MKKNSLILLGLLSATFTFAQNAPKMQMVPKIIYHAGAKIPLLQDIREHQIPIDVWNKYIMGESTSYDMPKVRRGLYGAEEAALTGLYGGNAMYDHRKNWMIGIVLKDSCRSGSAVDFNFDFEVLGNGRFAKWIHQKGYLKSNLALSCVENLAYEEEKPARKQPKPRLVWRSGPDYEQSRLPEEKRRLAEQCGAVIIEFFDESGIKVVYDTAFDDSWYIRDRDCIQDIQGSPDDLFQWIFVENFNFFKHSEHEVLEPNLFLTVQVLADPALSMLSRDSVDSLEAFETKMFKDYLDGNNDPVKLEDLNADFSADLFAALLARHTRACILVGKQSLLASEMNKVVELAYGPTPKDRENFRTEILLDSMEVLSRECGGKLEL